MKVLCIGHMAYDITFLLEKFPLENTKNTVDSCVTGGGGQACNAAYLLSKWGLDVDLSGVVGNDYYGNKILEELDDAGVNIKYVIQEDGDTDLSVIIASQCDRTILSKPSTRDTFVTIKDKYEAILLDGSMYDTALKVLENNPYCLTILDADKLNNHTIDLASKVKIVACSKTFAEKFSDRKIDDLDMQTLREIYDLLEQSFKNIVIITLDEKGSFVKINDRYEIIPSIQVETIDSTGAGDMYHAALLYFILQKYSLNTAIKLANITGALTTTFLGNRNQIADVRLVLELGENNDII